MTCYGAAILYYNNDLKEFKNRIITTEDGGKTEEKKWKKYCGVHVSDK